MPETLFPKQNLTWPKKLFKKPSFASLKKQESTKSSSTWLSKLFSNTKKSIEQSQPDVVIPVPCTHMETILSSDNTNDQAEVTSGSDNNNHHEKQVVPLRHFLRYSLNPSDQRDFQRRRITRPFEPKYEIEWQKNQWLLLDTSTNKQIEHMRRHGFSKIAIRDDSSLRKHIKYDHPSELDMLLELSFNSHYQDNSKQNKDQLEPIECHQPTHFSVRRSYWWSTSYKVAEAFLPDWVDADLCCDAIVMDAPSVLAAMTNYSSRSSSISSVQQQTTRPLDTPPPSLPMLSEKTPSSLHQQVEPWKFKPLQYGNAPFIMDKPTLLLS